MNMGDVKRKILINDYDEDVFSDNIKTNAIIEEIEEAEFAARQVQIDRQIDASQPTLLQKIWANISEKRHNIKKTASETIAHLRTKRPDDPRVEKRSWLKKSNAVSEKKTAKLQRPRILINRSNQIVVKNTHGLGRLRSYKIPFMGRVTAKNSHTPKLHFWRGSNSKSSLIAKLQNIEVPYSKIVWYCIVGVLTVVSIELLAWNFTHPLYHGQNVDKIPVTGSIEPSEMVIDDGETANAPENPSRFESESDQDEAATNTNQQDTESTTTFEPNAVNNYNYYGRTIYTIPQQTSANTRPASATNNTKSATTLVGQLNNTVNVDSNWSDQYIENWPPASQENVDGSDRNSDGDHANADDVANINNASSDDEKSGASSEIGN